MPTKDAMQFLEELTGGPLTLGEALESHRKCEEWSQAELGRRLGVSRAYINAIEKGRKAVSPAQAVRFAELFETGHAIWITLALEAQLRADGLNYNVSISAMENKKRRVQRKAL